MKLRIVEVDHDVIEYFLDRKPIICVNHDEHGWDGMDAVDFALRRFAKAAKIEIEEES